MQAAAPRGELAASAGLLFTAIAWGTMVPLTAVLLQDLPPFVIAAGRYSMAALVLAAIVAARERAPVLPLGLPWGRVMLLGGAGIGGFATCYTFGIGYSGPIAAAAILATQPVVAALMEWLATRRAIGGRMLIAVTLAVLGGLLVAFGGRDARASSAHGGEALLVIALVCWTWYSMKAQAWLAPLGIGQLRITLLTSGAAGLLLWLVYAVTAGLGLQPLPAGFPGAGHLGMLLWLAVGPTAIAIFTWNYGTGRLGIMAASLFLNLSPVFAALLGMALGAEPSWAELVGGGIAIGGVLLLQLGGRTRFG
ncbi:MAG TPA: DMT family transporter [Dongiaceae bacterium]|jgi:drug/metabolite transporter (DMT)-like permease|nr:DMT family transporter [Dongiaceae bacterium]